MELFIWQFEHGFASSAKEPYTQVDGKIAIENVDMDSTCVLLLSKRENAGRFAFCVKVSLNDFISSSMVNAAFEIVDEMYDFIRETSISVICVCLKIMS